MENLLHLDVLLGQEVILGLELLLLLPGKETDEGLVLHDVVE